MAMRDEVSVTCKKCGKDGTFAIYNGINTRRFPGIKAKVLDGSLFRYECPHCGSAGPLEYSTIYDSVEDKIAIYVNKKNVPVEESGIKGLMDTLSADDYLIRMVPDTNSLREKILIFDDGLDDRIIEIDKIYILYSLMDSSPEYLSAPGGCRIYYMGGKGVKNMVVLARGLKQLVMDISGPYEQLCTPNVMANLPPLRKSGPVIDRAWAAERMRMTEALKEMGCL